MKFSDVTILYSRSHDQTSSLNGLSSIYFIHVLQATALKGHFSAA